MTDKSRAGAIANTIDLNSSPLLRASEDLLALKADSLRGAQEFGCHRSACALPGASPNRGRE